MMAGTQRFVTIAALAWSIGAAPAPIVEQAPPRVETVRFESEAGVVLAGELQLPAVGKGPFPVVLLLGGGGPSPHGIYPLLEKRLLAKGVATLSFDKRGVGKSTGAFVDAMGPQQQDAAAALRYLRTRSDMVDVHRIAILGISQGGVIGPALAVDAPPIAAVVTMSAPAGERGALFLEAMREKLGTAGMPAAKIDPILDATRRLLDGVTTSAPQAMIDSDRAAVRDAFVAAGWTREQGEGAVKTLTDPATSSLYTVAAGDVLSRVTAPVLAVYAADDVVVSSRLAMPNAQAALRRNPDATIVQLPKVDHGYKPLVVTATGMRDYQGWPLSDTATLDLVERWLAPRLTPDRQ